MSGRKKTELPSVIDRDLIDTLSLSLDPVTPPANLRAKVLARTRQTPATDDVVTIRDREGDWTELGPGVEIKVLFVDEAAQTKSFLLRAQPGAQMPPHSHDGVEECLVLEGEFTLGDITLRAGDYHLAKPGAQHGAASTTTGVLVYLRAALSQYQPPA